MQDPATAETWQTAFGKDFGGMAQGDDKTGQKGTNAMFVMTHDEIYKVLAQKIKFTTGTRSSTIDPRRRILIVFVSRREETWCNMN
jgi:hypothetical protein